MPSIDLNGDVGFEHTDDVGTRGGTDSDDEENLFRREVGVTLTQLLFDGWESHYEVERQKARVVSSSERVRETAELVGLSIVEAYLEVLRQRQLLMITRDNVADHLKIQKQINDGISAGRSTEADGSQVKARLAAARATEASTRQALKDAETQFLRVVGDKPESLEMPVIPFESLAEDVEQEVRESLDHSPDIGYFCGRYRSCLCRSRRHEIDTIPAA